MGLEEKKGTPYNEIDQNIRSYRSSQIDNSTFLFAVYCIVDDSDIISLN